MRPKPDRLDGELFWTDRWEGSEAQLLPLEPRGLYREMLTAAWRRGASLPNDHEAIQRAVRCTAEEWARCWPKVSPYWRVEADRLVNDTQLEVYAETVAARERSHERAMKAAVASPQVIRKRERERAGGKAQASSHGEQEVEQEVKLTVTPLEQEQEQELLPSVSRLGSVSATGNGNGHRTEPGLSPTTSHLKHPPGALERYVRAIHEALSEKRGSLPSLSSVEFDMAAKWHDAGVPLRIILRGIQDCSRKPPNLNYAKPAILDAIEYWRKASA